MVQDSLLDEQVRADIDRTKALTREVEAAIEIKKIQLEILKKELAHKS